MLGTLFTCIIALFFLTAPTIQAIPESLFSSLFISSGSVFFLIITLVNLAALITLQKGQKHFFSGLIELFLHDSRSKWLNAFLWIFPLWSFLAAMISSSNLINQAMLVAIWFLSLGISIDLLILFLKRLFAYLNPFTVIIMLTHRALKQPNTQSTCLDKLTEIAVKGIDQASSPLCIQAIDAMQHIVTQQITKTKGETDPKQSSETQELVYLLMLLLQRWEFIHTKAINCSLEPISHHLTTELGKLSFYLVKSGTPFASLPLQFLGKLVKQAQEKGLKEIGVSGTLTLMEVAKSVLDEHDLSKWKIKPFFLSLIDQIDDIAKTTFKKEKGTNIKILIQPFLELKEQLQQEKYASHPDVAPILRDLDRVLSEFSALEAVLLNMPKIAPSTP